MTRPRIVSLLPSPTEIVTALGVESALVGHSLSELERIGVNAEFMY
jgi:ABC-type hemin transport system substrate-binding protein